MKRLQSHPSSSRTSTSDGIPLETTCFSRHVYTERAAYKGTRTTRNIFRAISSAGRRLRDRGSRNERGEGSKNGEKKRKARKEIPVPDRGRHVALICRRTKGKICGKTTFRLRDCTPGYTARSKRDRRRKIVSRDRRHSSSRLAAGSSRERASRRR